MNFTPSPDQLRAIAYGGDAIRSAQAGGGSAVIAISGEAGTGKITIAEKIMAQSGMHRASLARLTRAARKGKGLEPILTAS